MAEHLVKTLCHIVFILKLYSKFLLGLFHCPAYLQLAPLPEELCSSGNAAYYQWSIGIMGLSPLRGSLRAAPKKRDGSIIIPNFSIMAISRHHMSVETASLLSLSSSLRSPVTGFWAEKTSSMQATHSHRRLFETSGHSVKLANGVFVISVNCGSL